MRPRSQSTGLPADRLHPGPVPRAPILPTVCWVVPDEPAAPALTQQHGSSPTARNKAGQPLQASHLGRPHAGLSKAAWLARALEDCVSGTDGSGDYDAGIQSAQPQLAADAGVDEPQSVLTEPGSEFGAAQVRLIGDLEDCRADRQPRAAAG
jgi:hypothetical protein